jgi:hypothetical protein
MRYFKKSTVGSAMRVVRHDGVRAVVTYHDQHGTTRTVYDMSLEDTKLALNL